MFTIGKKYLSSALPDGHKNQNILISQWGGLNRLSVIDSGYISECKNCAVSEDLNFVEPLECPSLYKNFAYSFPLSFHGFQNFLIVVYMADSKIKIDYIKDSERYTCVLPNGKIDDLRPRTIIRANTWSGDLNIATSSFIPKLLVYPDMYSFDFVQTKNFDASYFGANIPHSNDACMHLSRVFSILSDRVFATGKNYADYAVSTADSINDSDAWGSLVEGNTKSDGKLTAITSFDSHVVVFKSDFLYEIYNTKNPFRIVDVSKNGTIDKRSLCEVSGKLFFVSQDGIFSYAGGSPREISKVLNIDKYTFGIAGAYKGKYYLYQFENNLHKVFIYNTINSMFGCLQLTNEPIGFVSNDNGFFALLKDGKIYKINSENFSNTFFEFDTEIYTHQTVIPKRISEIRILCETESNSALRVSLMVNNNGLINKEEPVYTLPLGAVGLVPIRIKIRGKFEKAYKLHFEGNGKIKIHNMEVIM